VEHTPASSATFRFNPQWSQKIPVFPVVERPSLGGAWFSRTSKDGSHLTRSTAAMFVFVLLYFWAYLLCHSPLVHPSNGVSVLLTQYTFQITFNDDPGFVASVPQANGPASPEALRPRTFIFTFLFRLPNLYFVFSILL
jgi:hypothetical protein